MTRRTWAKLLALYALAALVVPFLGTSVPSCFGRPGPGGGQMSPACIAAWEAGRSLFPDRFVEAVGAPASAVLTFLALVAVTLAVDLARRRLGHRPRDIQRR
jgi:hypothetical protein